MAKGAFRGGMGCERRIQSVSSDEGRARILAEKAGTSGENFSELNLGRMCVIRDIGRERIHLSP